MQYRGCGKEGKYIHFTSEFLLNDGLTAGYGSRGKCDQSRNRQWTAVFIILCSVLKGIQRPVWDLPFGWEDRPHAHKKDENQSEPERVKHQISSPDGAV